MSSPPVVTVLVLTIGLLGLVALPVAGDPSRGAQGDDCGAAADDPFDDGTGPLQAVTMTTARRLTGGWEMQTPGLPFTGQSATGAGVRVAVVDSGIDPDHPDLSGRVVAWRDFVNEQSDPYDDHGHGTHVAGIIAGQGHLQTRASEHYFPAGMRGVAPEAELIIAKAIDAEGSGSAQRVAQAILWSLDPDGDGDPEDGADVINLSLGTGLQALPRVQPDEEDAAIRPGSGQAAIQKAIRQATDQGAVVVVAAGNQRPGEARCIGFPASMPEVITVGATDGAGAVAAFSRSGPSGSSKPDLVAPGLILSAGVTNEGSAGADYRAEAGTSMATPMVTGAVALLMQSDPVLNGEAGTGGDGAWRTQHVRAVLTQTAKPIAGAGVRDGHGLLRIDAALRHVADDPWEWARVPSSAPTVAGLLLVGLFTRPAPALSGSAPAPPGGRKREPIHCFDPESELPGTVQGRGTADGTSNP